MASYDKQFSQLVSSLGLGQEDIQLAISLPSFHEIEREIFIRTDTKQYIYIESESSYKDGVDDYFKWRYITEDEKNEIVKRNISYDSAQYYKNNPHIQFHFLEEDAYRRKLVEYLRYQRVLEDEIKEKRITLDKLNQEIIELKQNCPNEKHNKIPNQINIKKGITCKLCNRFL